MNPFSQQYIHLPDLPPACEHGSGNGYRNNYYYTPEQMRDYAIAAARLALEERSHVFLDGRFPISWYEYWASRDNSALGHNQAIFACANDWVEANLEALRAESKP